MERNHIQKKAPHRPFWWIMLWPQRPDCDKRRALQLLVTSVLLVPDGQQFVQQIGSSSEQSPSGQIQRFPPPRVRAQSWHYPAVVLQWVGNDVPIKRELLIGAQQAGGEALLLAKINHTRPRPSDAPVHALRLRPLSASLWQLGASSAEASWMPRAAGAGRRGEEQPAGHKHPARCLSPQRGRHPPQPAGWSLPPVTVNSHKINNNVRLSLSE